MDGLSVQLRLLGDALEGRERVGILATPRAHAIARGEVRAQGEPWKEAFFWVWEPRFEPEVAPEARIAHVLEAIEADLPHWRSLLALPGVRALLYIGVFQTNTRYWTALLLNQQVRRIAELGLDVRVEVFPIVPRPQPA